jgi:outer membrane protein assembly complex protein YaeT
MTVAYRAAGYPFATVGYDLNLLAEKLVVTFSIDEGPRVTISNIGVTGNTVFDEKSLLAFFEGHTTFVLGQGALLYVESDIKQWTGQIRDHYLGHGYLDVIVHSPEIVFSADRTNADVTARIAEGVRFTVKEVKLEGDSLPEAIGDLNKVRTDLISKSYVPQLKLSLKSRILEVYGNLGYAHAVADVKDQLDRQSGDVILSAMVHSGPRVKIAAVSVQGNHRTRESFIRNRCRLKPGDTYSLEAKQKSFRQLYKTGLFSRIDITLEKREGMEGEILVVQVDEAPSSQVYLEPGWGSYERLRVVTGYRDRNLFGTGKILNPEIALSMKAQRASLEFTDPWFLNTQIKGVFPAYFNRREEPSFTREDVGLSAIFRRSLTKNWTASAGYNVSMTELSDVDGSASAEEIGEDYDLGSVELQTTYDTRNDFFFPTKGQRLFLSGEQAAVSLGGSLTFTKLTGGIRLFLPVAKTAVLGLRYRTGLIVPGPDELNIPLGERFFNGGENTVRSFKESELGPQDASRDPIGGLGYNVANIELRKRIVGNFIGTVFCDYGNISPNRSQFEKNEPPYDDRSDLVSDTLEDFFKDFRPGVGFGLQYLLPIGPARIDLAFNPDRDKSRDEDSYVVHFSVGAAF